MYDFQTSELINNPEENKIMEEKSKKITANEKYVETVINMLKSYVRVYDAGPLSHIDIYNEFGVGTKLFDFTPEQFEAFKKVFGTI